MVWQRSRRSDQTIWACWATLDTLQAIASEAGVAFSREVALAWLEVHKEGWFIRHEGSPFDGMFLHPDVFKQFYKPKVNTHPYLNAELFIEIVEL